MGCCCLGMLGLWLGPRLILVLLWFLTDWTTYTFRTQIYPLLGFVFFPCATLFYLLSMHYHGYRKTGATTAWTILGLLLDLSVAGGTHQQHQMSPSNFQERQHYRVMYPVGMPNRTRVYEEIPLAFLNEWHLTGNEPWT